MNRREFSITLGRLVIAVPIGAALVGCPVEDDDVPQECTEAVANNHGHSLVVPAVDVRTGDTKTYQLTLGTDHTHSVLVTAEDMARLADGVVLTLDSSTDDSEAFGPHSHQVQVSCD